MVKENNNTSNKIAMFFAVVVVLVIGAYVFIEQAYVPASNPPLIGGNKDTYGCIGSAGYSWCEIKQKCLRPWEEKCEAVATSTVAVTSTVPVPIIPVDVTSGAIITLDNNGQSIQMKVGDSFLLKLGETYNWGVVSIDDEAIVGRKISAFLAQGAQGIFEAKKFGTTQISVVGDLPCRESTPPCAAPSQIFRLSITVL